MRSLLFLLLLLVFPATALAQTVIVGRVTDGAGEPLAFANVQVVGTLDGAATDRAGGFRFVTKQTGTQTIQASMLGMEPHRHLRTLVGGDTLALRFVLRETLVTLDEAVVTASAYAMGEATEATLASMEVVTTPGAAADLFLAVKTLPGVAMVDEGAGLFVRGGDVDETVLLLDQATVVHPYKHETPTGGVFGTISPFLVDGTYFSSGGFSARYGNALSSVLAMESHDLPRQRQFQANLGLAAASLGADLPIIPGKLGVRFSGNRSFSELMFRVNGQADRFTTVPQGYDGNLSIVYQYRPTGRLKFFNFVNSDRVGVAVDEPAFDGVFNGRTTRTLHNLQWTDLFGDWLVQASASLGHYVARRQLGNLDLRPRDDTWKLRTDAERDLSERLRVRIGAEVEHTTNAFTGSVPQQQDILAPDAATWQIDEAYSATRTGGFAEVEAKLTRRILATAGLRADAHNLAGTTVVDPRLSLRYLLSKNTDLRFAWGHYHQFASPYAYNPGSGNPDLGPQAAQHFIAGISHEQGLFQLRLEGYYKTYRDLVLADEAVPAANLGDGYARGVDVFLQYGAFLRTRANGWISYSFLDSERKQARYLGESLIHETGPSPFDITHNLTIVGKTRLIGFLTAGATYRYATGRPVTPVTGAVPGNDPATFYLPIEGAVGSTRLPDFQRLDLSLSYYLPFGTGDNAVFYLAVSNLLARANAIDYTYNRDYSERRTRLSTYRRFVYFGVSLALN